jgi:hypothetical protein
MQWFLEEEEEEENEELAEAPDDERERARKKELPGRVFNEMVVVSQHLDEVKLLVTELKMEEDPEVELVKFDLLGDYHRNGITRLCLIDCGEIEPMELQQADLVTMSEAAKELDWAALKLSKKISFDRDEVQGLMEETSRLLPLLNEELEGLLGPEKMGEMCHRHLLLEEGLRETTMTRRTAKLFPQDLAGAIMEWYVRLVTGLRAL